MTSKNVPDTFDSQAPTCDVMDIVRSARHDAPLVLIIVAYCVAIPILAWSLGVPERMRFALYWDALCFMTLRGGLAYLTVRVVYVLAKQRPQHPLACVGADLRDFLPRHIITALPLFLILPLFMSAFSSAKCLIPIVQPFTWDPVFARWDVALHGGRQPWELLLPLVGHPALLNAIQWGYGLWLLVMFVVVWWQLFNTADPARRTRFFLTYLLAWILLGTVGGMAFSSAGPCFYDKVAPDEPNPYAELMAHLKKADEFHSFSAPTMQDYLWRLHVGGQTSPISGISAMPSMHISMALLFLLVAKNRLLRVALGVFFGVICLGCVALGWHYAVDAYAAIVGTWLIWWAVGRLPRCRSTTSPMV